VIYPPIRGTRRRSSARRIWRCGVHLHPCRLCHPRQRAARLRASCARSVNSAQWGRGIEVDHQLELCRSWAYRPHAAASLRLRSSVLRPAFCDFLGGGTGSWARSVVAASVDAVTAVVIALSGVVCGELDGDAESCRLSGALIAGEGGETIVEG